uniref:aldo-keto reductase family 1 member B7-like n=1 Tax=Styela clava TaxID=7725 RepID=UPI001939795A|nr:aldo-keto reductase family 1 member B7-like [Styela clava]
MQLIVTYRYKMLMNKTTTLNTGAKMPTLGLGTWKSKPGEVRAAVEAAIDVGYRHIDCAFAYLNENEVGDAIQAKIKEGKVKREDLFITTKLWMTYFKHAEECIEKSLKSLKLNYVDLYLIHWPVGLQYSPASLIKLDEDGKWLFDENVHYNDVWKSMENIQKMGLTKAIGISNFNKYQIAKLLDNCSIVPAVHQYECHPYFDQDDLLHFCQSKGIVVTAYSPFGCPDRPWAKTDDPNLFGEPELKKIATKHGKTVAQVLLRYQLQKGMVVIPKSVTPSRIQSNIQVFDFDLTEEDNAIIKKQNRGWRIVSLAECVLHKYHPFRDNYSE